MGKLNEVFLLFHKKLSCERAHRYRRVLPEDLEAVTVRAH